MKGSKVQKTATVKPKVATEKVYAEKNSDFKLPDKIFAMPARDPYYDNLIKTTSSQPKRNPVKSNHLTEAISSQSTSNEGITAKKIVKKPRDTPKTKNKCDKMKTTTANSNREKEESTKIESKNLVPDDKDNDTDVYKEEIVGDYFIIHIYTGEEPDDYDINDLIRFIEKQEEAHGFYR